MKVSGQKAAEHREALVETARRLLQLRGFDGAGVAEISRAAGLTQGALYSHFGSKSDLAREAAARAFAEGYASLADLRVAGKAALPAVLDAYLNHEHVDDAGSGCLMAACVSDVSRQDEALGAVFAEGFRDWVSALAGAMPDGTAPEAAQRRAMTLVSAMVGAVAMARALQKTDPALSRAVIEAAREELEALAGRDTGPG